MTGQEFYSCFYCGTDTWESGHLLRVNGVECTCCNKCYNEHYNKDLNCVVIGNASAD